MKVDREMDAAIAKHGETLIPSVYHEDWEKRVQQEKAKIVAHSL